MIQKLRKNKKSILRTGLILVVVLAVVVLALVSSGFLLPSKQVQASPDPDWLTGWAERIKITTDQTDIDVDLTDFPVLVKLTSANFDFTKALSTGNDIRFTASDGTTLLKYERERHDSTNSLAEYWVKIPSVSSTVNTDFYIYYGNPDAVDGADPTAVWDANFKGVWHKKDITTSTIADSTANANNGTKKAVNEPIEADGKIEKAQSFDGVNDWVALPEPPAASTNINTGSVFAWIKTQNAGTSFRGIVVKQLAYGMFLQDNIFGIYDWGNTIWRSSAVNLADNLWHFVGFTFENIDAAAPSNNAKLYLDGELKVTVTLKLQNHNEGIVIGAGNNPGVSQFFNGLIDEVRIYNRALSAAEISAIYNATK